MLGSFRRPSGGRDNFTRSRRSGFVACCAAPSDARTGVRNNLLDKAALRQRVGSSSSCSRRIVIAVQCVPPLVRVDATYVLPSPQTVWRAADQAIEVLGTLVGRKGRRTTQTRANRPRRTLSVAARRRIAAAQRARWAKWKLKHVKNGGDILLKHDP